MQNIYNKLAKKTPAKLSKRSVKLNALQDNIEFIDNIKTDISSIAGESIADLYDIELRLLQISGLMENVAQASKDMQVMEEQILDLGIDTPAEFNDLLMTIIKLELLPDIKDLGDKLEEVRLELGHYSDI